MPLLMGERPLSSPIFSKSMPDVKRTRSVANTVRRAPRTMDDLEFSLPSGSVMQTIIPGRLSFVFHRTDFRSFLNGIERSKMKSHHFFTSTLHNSYIPFCADFGPVNLGVVMQFCDFMEKKFAKPLLAGRHLVYACDADCKSGSNACFLLASFLCVNLRWSVAEAVQPFRGIAERYTRPFRDATFGASTFDLTLENCIGGLVKAMEHKWLDSCNFDIAEYLKWDSPRNGDLHRICPKLIAFKSPAGQQDEDGEGREGVPSHSVQHYAEAFRGMGVSAVVRLTEADTYDSAAFEAAGIQLHDLFFADCTCPPLELVDRFVGIVDAAPGVVAVHCLAGLGRTGTLIAGWLMHRRGFSAREAMGWLRVVRPGSVIGEQQQFLTQLEGGGPPREGGEEAEEEEERARRAAELAEEVKGGVQRRWEQAQRAGGSARPCSADRTG